jgi:phosphoserine phosphatase
MKLVIIRHGETMWNLQKRTQGVTDIPLSPNGVEQAGLTRDALRSEVIAAAYASPLKRALNTAEIICEGNHVQVEPKPELMEFAFGVWEGMAFHEIEEHYPAEMETWKASPHRFSVLGSETLQIAAKRLRRFISGIESVHSNDTVLVVAHSITSRLIIADAIGLPIKNLHALRMDNAGISVIDFRADGNVLRTMNDTSHLRRVPG